MPVRVFRQVGVVVTLILRNLLAKPNRALEAFVLVFELNLGNDQPRIFVGEDIDFPHVLSAPDQVASLLDRRANTQIV